VLEAAGWETCRVGEAAPATAPDLVILLHDRSRSWEDLARVLSWAGEVPAIYVGTWPGEAERRLPEMARCLPRPVRSVALRAAFEEIGLPWSPAPTRALAA
jgi:hypothetical protein